MKDVPRSAPVGRGDFAGVVDHPVHARLIEDEEFPLAEGVVK